MAKKINSITFSTDDDVAYYLHTCKAKECINVSKLLTKLIKQHMKRIGVLGDEK